MSDTPTADTSFEALRSRWNRALSGEEDDRREALTELAASYWYGVYAWWRRSGLEAADAVTATLACFNRWLSDAPPKTSDSGASRMREWLAVRLAELVEQGVELTGPPAITIDPVWAEGRYADEPAGDPETIFQRRWAICIIEFTAWTLRAEYAARGEDGLFGELLVFAGFETADAERYDAVAMRLGHTVGAIHKAVFDFRTRQREILRAFTGDTLFDLANADSEITALLCAWSAPGAEGANAPLPSVIKSLRPDEVLARAMQSVRMTQTGRGGWQPPTVEEAARLFPEYEVVSLLGRGGMGAVYKARQIELDRFVAIKLLPLEVSVDRDFGERFRREARALGKLNHPNILAVHKFGTTAEGHLFFVMEYVEGANLQQMIRGPGLAPMQALVILGGVCDALAYAHGKGVVHRDIKPANVMVSVEGHVKVADFGLARLTDPTASIEQAGYTVTGTIIGTLDYMAPEQMRGGIADHRADIYSLGVMLYEMLCKEVPRGIFDPPSVRVPGMSKRIDHVVTKAMAQQSDRRYQSTLEMKSDVAAVASILLSRPAVPRGIAAPPARPASMPTMSARKSKAPFWMGIAAVLVGLAATVGYLKWQKDVAALRAEGTGSATNTTQHETAAAAAATPIPQPTPTPEPGTAEIGAPNTSAPAKPVPAPAAPAAAPQTAIGKWLAEQAPQWEAAYASEVTTPFQKRVDDLKQGYAATLAMRLAAATRNLQSAEAAAFREEQKHIAEGGEVPGADDPADQAALKSVRLTYRKNATALEAAREAKAKAIVARYDTSLAQSQAVLTQQGRLDEGLEIKAVRGQLALAWLKPAATPLERSLESATKGHPFVNTLGMTFVPVPITGGPTGGRRVLFSIWETRVQDYQVFASESKLEWQKTDFTPGATDPAVNVSWEDAQRFCQWLTIREQAAGRLPAGWRYRLPSDHEWSCAVEIGAREDAAQLPIEKRGKIDDAFPWGAGWPPPKGAGNYAGEELRPILATGKHSWIKDVIADYEDGFVNTSPVGNFAANRFGLFDLGGNAWEWCQDWCDQEQTKRVLRGGSWDQSSREFLLSSIRMQMEPSARFEADGFRCVVDAAAPTVSMPPSLIASASSSAAAATKDHPFVNSLGMKFVPVPILGGPTSGQRVLFSVWDTRVQDYEVFAKETKHEWPKPDFAQDGTHPAVNVSWDDAQLFCQWLTARDQAARRLSGEWRYRLPSDFEWSCAVGIGDREDPAKLPAEKRNQIDDAFPWGSQWPPPPGVGNYAGEEVQPAVDAGTYPALKRVLAGYNDGFVNTSPVGSFAANPFGLYDMGGNVWQWCEDWFDKQQKGRVRRGAAWNYVTRAFLLSSFREWSAPEDRGSRILGFRCVLAASGDPAAAGRSTQISTAPTVATAAGPSSTLSVPKTEIRGIREMKFQDAIFADGVDRLNWPCLRINLRTSADLKGEEVIGKAYYFDGDYKLLSQFEKMPKATHTDGAYGLPPILKAHTEIDVYVPIETVDKDGKWRSVVLVFGDPRKLDVAVFPRRERVAWKDFDFPERAKLLEQLKDADGSKK